MDDRGALIDPQSRRQLFLDGVMRLNRLFLALAACATAALLVFNVAGCGGADAAQPTGAARGQLKIQSVFYRMQLGDFEVTAITDGTIPLPYDQMLSHITPAEVAELVADGFNKLPVETSINTYLINTGSKLILVDAGAGSLFRPYGGRLIENLKVAGYTPEEIDVVLLTHLHGDHSGGLTDANGKRLFPNATVYLDRADRDYRFDPNAEAAAPANQKSMFPQSRAAITPYESAGKVNLFTGGGVQLFPGITTIAAHGHTPGHTLYSIESKAQRLVIAGDLVHVAEVQLPRPEVTISFDADEAGAAVDRKKFFDQFAVDRTMIAAAHIAFPGIGNLKRAGNGFQWYPVPYSLNGMAN